MAEARAATRPVSARRRVAPARGPGGIRWDRVARLALVVTLGAIVLLYIPPAAHWLSQSREAAREHGRLRQLTGEHRQLERRIGELRTPGALEAEARRLGSSFLLGELADLYGSGTDWAAELAFRRGAGSESSSVVDAAFARYAGEASDYAGGRMRGGGGRPG